MLEKKDLFIWLKFMWMCESVWRVPSLVFELFVGVDATE